MYQSGAVVINENTSEVREKAYKIRNEMKKKHVLVNNVIQLDYIDLLHVHKLKEIMNYHHIDFLIISEDTYDLIDSTSLNLTSLLDFFDVSYYWSSEQQEDIARKALLLYDEHLTEMISYCKGHGITSDLQLEMQGFKTAIDQRYLLETMKENELDYVLMEHADQCKDYFTAEFLQASLQSGFEIIAPLENMNISDIIIEEQCCMNKPITVPDKVVIITEKVNSKNLRGIKQSLYDYYQNHDFDLIDYIETNKLELSDYDCDKLYQMVATYKIDRILLQTGMQLPDKLRNEFPTIPVVKIEVSTNFEEELLQEMVE